MRITIVPGAQAHAMSSGFEKNEDREEDSESVLQVKVISIVKDSCVKTTR